MGERTAAVAAAEGLVGQAGGLVVGTGGLELLLGDDPVADQFAGPLIGGPCRLIGDAGPFDRVAVLQVGRRDVQQRTPLVHLRTFGEGAGEGDYARDGGHDGLLVSRGREDAAAGDDHLAEGAADDRIHDDACGAGLFGRQRDLAGMAVPGFGFVSVGLALFRCFVLVEVGLHGGIVLFVGMIMRTRAVAGDQRQGAEQGHKGSRFHGFLSIVFLFPGQR